MSSNFCFRDLKDHEFRIQHYAGRVKYKINGFVEKNQDQLYSTISTACYSSKSQLLRDCFPEGILEIFKSNSLGRYGPY